MPRSNSTFKHKTITLKSGDQISIRVPEEKEAQNLMNLKRAYLKNTSTIPVSLEEYPENVAKESKLIKSYAESENSILLIVEFGDEFIGNIDLTGSKNSKMFHTGMIGMGIKEPWRNQGIGRALIESVIEWAKAYSPIEIIWLDVYASNKLGYNLYKNTGFKVSGVIKDFFKEGNSYKDKLQMYQRIKEKVINDKRQ